MKPKIARTIVVNKRINEVIEELRLEGWEIIKRSEGKAFLRPSRGTDKRISKASFN